VAALEEASDHMSSDESGSAGAEDKAGVCAGKQHRDILPNVHVLLRVWWSEKKREKRRPAWRTVGK
jgi:hypothetical protein